MVFVEALHGEARAVWKKDDVGFPRKPASQIIYRCKDSRGYSAANNASSFGSKIPVRQNYLESCWIDWLADCPSSK
eukprot:scaffold213_cov94-Cylindrotheca_fusiformis.AAC.5